MRKILVFYMCVLILTVCSACSEDYYNEEGFNVVKALDKYADLSVLLYGDKEIYFYQIGGGEENGVLILYEHDLDSNKTMMLALCYWKMGSLLQYARRRRVEWSITYTPVKTADCRYYTVRDLTFQCPL